MTLSGDTQPSGAVVTSLHIKNKLVGFGKHIAQSKPGEPPNSVTSSGDAESGGGGGGGHVATEPAPGTPLHLLLVLHAPILEPDLHLALGQHQPLRQFPADRLRDVHRRHVDPLQLGQLVLRVRTPLLARRSRRRASRLHQRPSRRHASNTASR